MATIEETIKPMDSSDGVNRDFQIKTHSAQKLARQIERSEFRMAKYRIKSNEILAAWCGPRYATAMGGSGDLSQPVNTLATIASIILPNIIGTNVRCHVTAKRGELRGYDKLFELRINQALEERRFGGTILRGAINSLTGT